MSRIRVDFNNVRTDGTLTVSTRRAEGPIVAGETVVVYDPAEQDMRFNATVLALDPDSDRATLHVSWAPEAVVEAHVDSSPSVLTCGQSAGFILTYAARLGGWRTTLPMAQRGQRVNGVLLSA